MRIILVIFLASCCLVLVPFTTYEAVEGPQLISPQPAGPIIHGRRLTQHVDISLSVDDRERAKCLGVYFATYSRNNDANLDLVISQGGRTAQWQIDSSKLRDNKFRYFCPDEKVLNFGSPFDFSISSRGGDSTNSPTVWLTADNKFGEVTFDGVSRDQAVMFSINSEHAVTWRSLWRTRHGALVIAWMCSVLIGLLLLFFGGAPIHSRKLGV